MTLRKTGGILQRHRECITLANHNYRSCRLEMQDTGFGRTQRSLESVPPPGFDYIRSACLASTEGATCARDAVSPLVFFWVWLSLGFGPRKISSQGTAKLLALAWPWLGPAQAMALAQSQKKPKPKGHGCLLARGKSRKNTSCRRTGAAIVGDRVRGLGCNERAVKDASSVWKESAPPSSLRQVGYFGETSSQLFNLWKVYDIIADLCNPLRKSLRVFNSKPTYASMAEQTEGIHSMLLLVGNSHNIIFPLPRKFELFSSIETGGLVQNFKYHLWTGWALGAAGTLSPCLSPYLYPHVDEYLWESPSMTAKENDDFEDSLDDGDFDAEDPAVEEEDNVSTVDLLRDNYLELGLSSTQSLQTSNRSRA
ncbi:hypothetical protein B0H14DRAFT_2645844 [Mycena olivaceomarginata]|nr:hypothetical protein B0H14DRAFT_2645844 [Mycena olivaceomarginata]